MIHLASQIPRNAALLLMLLVLIIGAPLVPAAFSQFIVELMFDAILLAGVYSVSFSKKHEWPFLVLTVVTLAVRWGELLHGADGLDLGALMLSAIWLFYALSLIVVHLFRERDVDVDTILGAVVTYLLAAVAFGMVFQLIELQSPGSFSGIPDTAHGQHSELSSTMMYFSLVCITTMGYGEIVPVSNLARPIAVLVGVFGQIYLAVMIARLVGLHIASGRDDHE